MILDADACYRAIASRDQRFDGVFFVGVKTTGIYCRPVCRARTPGRDRCVFFERAVLAEKAGFRACFRCRPERAPGHAPIDAVPRLVTAAMRRMQAGALNEGSVDDLACELGVTARHLRRTFRAEIGVSPVEFAQTRRVALARELLLDTSMPITDVAFASGFGSVRRFNAAFRAIAGRAPSALRRTHRGWQPNDPLRLFLDYRAPYAWDSIRDFLRMRAIPGVEEVANDAYARTVRVGDTAGWIRVSPVNGRHSLALDVAPSLTSVLLPVVTRVRHLFDLDARPSAISDHLGQDARLASLIGARPGLRVPGAFDPAEIGARAILGQQVSVAAARTLAGRLARELGDPIDTPFPSLDRVWPRPRTIAAASESKLLTIPLTRARASALRHLMAAIAGGDIVLDATSANCGDGAILSVGAATERLVARLQEVPGVGPWTAEYIAMRALGWPDAFPEGDLVLRKALGGMSARACGQVAESWRPFRSYAALHLWASFANSAG